MLKLYDFTSCDSRPVTLSKAWQQKIVHTQDWRNTHCSTIVEECVTTVRRSMATYGCLESIKREWTRLVFWYKTEKLFVLLRSVHDAKSLAPRFPLPQRKKYSDPNRNVTLTLRSVSKQGSWASIVTKPHIFSPELALFHSKSYKYNISWLLTWYTFHLIMW